MLGQISLDTILLFLLYGAGTMAALIACLYLMLRRGNAIAPEVTSPVRRMKTSQCACSWVDCSTA